MNRRCHHSPLLPPPVNTSQVVAVGHSLVARDPKPSRTAASANIYYYLILFKIPNAGVADKNYVRSTRYK